MLVVVDQQFEDDFQHGEKVLVGLETLQFGGVPGTEDVRVYAPYYIVEQIREKGH
jgi:hypothetical protein